MRIFLDANILFSAAKSDGAVRELLRRVIEQGHVLCADGYVVGEAERNLHRKGPETLHALESLLQTVEVVPFQPGEVSAEAARLLPVKDQPVLAAAIRLGCDALLTGDRTHFGALYGSRIGGVMIYSARLLAESVLR